VLQITEKLIEGKKPAAILICGTKMAANLTDDNESFESTTWW